MLASCRKESAWALLLVERRSGKCLQSREIEDLTRGRHEEKWDKKKGGVNRWQRRSIREEMMDKVDRNGRYGIE